MLTFARSTDACATRGFAAVLLLLGVPLSPAGCGGGGGGAGSGDTGSSASTGVATDASGGTTATSAGTASGSTGGGTATTSASGGTSGGSSTASTGGSGSSGGGGPAPTVDPNPTPETRGLFEALRDLAPTHLLVGMENATREGEFQNTKPIDGYNSDIREVCSQGPMVHGFDVAAVVGDWWPGNPSQQQLMQQHQEEYRAHMRLIYERGGFSTMAWHALNPIDGSDAWNGPHELWQLVEPARCAALEAEVGPLQNCGAAFDVFSGRVAILADFFESLQTDAGTPIPVVFRPFHENTGGWFWWGAPNVDPAVYHASLREVWSWMVDYMHVTRDLHQLLWAISPNGGGIDATTYAAALPGMGLVDIFGYDIYPDDMHDYVGEIGAFVTLAEANGKIPVVTETGPGLAGDPNAWDTDVWSQKVIGPILDDPTASRVAYVMLWFNRPGGSHWGPYAGHPASPDFLTLCSSDTVYMEGETDLYP